MPIYQVFFLFFEKEIVKESGFAEAYSDTMTVTNHKFLDVSKSIEQSGVFKPNRGELTPEEVQVGSGKGTIFPVYNLHEVPENLLKALHSDFNYVLDEGRTYPMYNTMSFAEFLKSWFVLFVAILIEGSYSSLSDPRLSDKPLEWWEHHLLGSFYVKSNYAGRCSHVCNGGFVVSHKRRGLGLGKILGLQYLKWAPKLGYIYSVFNLVFESNIASWKLWDSLGFERIGFIKNSAVLKGESGFQNAIMYGKDLLS